MTTIRFGQIIGIRPERFESYKTIHKSQWEEIIAGIKECNINNYSILRKNSLLFACFEYTGNNFQVDMQKMQRNPVTREWWELLKPMQQPVAKCLRDEWKEGMEEIFKMD